MTTPPTSSAGKARFHLGPLQFNIIHLLGAMVVGVVIFTCVGGIYREGVARKTAEKLLEELGGKLAIAPSKGPGPVDSYRRSLSFIKPLDDAGAEKLAPYAQWMTGIVELDLSNTKISGPSLAAFKQMPHLESLILDGTAVDDESLAELSGHVKLAKLSLNKTAITGPGLRHLASLPALEELFLSDSGLGGTSLTELSQCRKLEILDLSGTQVTSDGLAPLRGLRNLKELDLARTPIDDQAMSTIKRMESLERLELSKTKVTESIIAPLEHLKHLEELGLIESRLAPDDIERLKRAMPKLEVLEKAKPVAPPTLPGPTMPKLNFNPKVPFLP